MTLKNMTLKEAYEIFGPIVGQAEEKAARQQAAKILNQEITRVVRILAAQMHLDLELADEVRQNYLIELMRRSTVQPIKNDQAVSAALFWILKRRFIDHLRKLKRQHNKHQALKREPSLVPELDFFGLTAEDDPDEDKASQRLLALFFDVVVPFAARQGAKPQAFLEICADLRRLAIGQVLFRDLCTAQDLAEATLYKRHSRARAQLLATVALLKKYSSGEFCQAAPASEQGLQDEIAAIWDEHALTAADLLVFEHIIDPGLRRKKSGRKSAS